MQPLFQQILAKKTVHIFTLYARESNAVRDIFKSAGRRCGGPVMGWRFYAHEKSGMDRMTGNCSHNLAIGVRRGTHSMLAALGTLAIVVGALSSPSAAEPRHGGGYANSESASPGSDPGVIDGWRADTSTAEDGRGRDTGAAVSATEDAGSEVSRLLVAARDAEARGQRDIAQRLFEQVIATEPTSPEAVAARRRLGAIYRDEHAVTATPPATSNGVGQTVTLSPLPELATGKSQERNGADGVAERAADGIGPANLDAGTLEANPQKDIRETTLATPVLPPSGPIFTSPQPWRSKARPSYRFEQLLRADVGDRIFFGTGSADIGTRARSVLERQAEWLARYPDLYIVVEGHSDEPGSEADNNAIARLRAETARRLLTGVGIKPDRIDIEVIGRKDPVATCESSECHSQNRRAVIRMMLVLPDRPGDRSSLNNGPAEQIPPG